MAITTQYGCEVAILSAIHHGTEITGAVCKRVEDGAERSYLLGELRAPGGAYEVYTAVCEAHAKTASNAPRQPKPCCSQSLNW